MSREHLLKAADIVEAGWTRGSLYRQHPERHCLVGALRRAHGIDPQYAAHKTDYIQDVQLLRKILAVDSLEVWNDFIGRRKQAVVKLLRDAAGGVGNKRKKLWRRMVYAVLAATRMPLPSYDWLYTEEEKNTVQNDSTMVGSPS